MKYFVKENWYKLMIGSSLFIFSVGFFINSVSPVYSSYSDKTKNSLKVLPNKQKVIQVPVNDDGSVNVKLSEEQMKELKSIPMDKTPLVKSSGSYFQFVVHQPGDGHSYGLPNGKSGRTGSDWEMIK
jgi:hypothetical protein